MATQPIPADEQRQPHVMLLGDLMVWCYENLAGIRSDKQQVAFKHIVLRPDFEIQELSKVDASHITPYGKVVAKQKTPTHLEWDVEIPANTTAEFCTYPMVRWNKSVRVLTIITCKFPLKQRLSILSDEFCTSKHHSRMSRSNHRGDSSRRFSSFFGGTKERVIPIAASGYAARSPGK